MSSFQLTSQIQRAVTDVLAVHCGDYRSQGAFHEFLSQSLGLQENYDLMVIPGGPLSLTLFEYLPKFSWSSWKWLRFFVEQHEVKRLVLIQHQDCAWYKTMPLHLHASPEPRERQEQDLRRVREAMKKDFAQLSVALYYAGWDSSGRVMVEEVPA